MKKVFTLLVVSILFLAGCTNSESADSSSSGEFKSLEEALASIEGETITIATSSMGADNPNSEQAAENHDQGHDSDERKQFLADVESTYGVTFEFIDLDPAMQVETVTESVLSGTPIADVVRVNAGNYEALVRTGMLEDITPIANMVYDTGVLPTWSLQIGQILGGTYAIGRNRDPRPEMLAFNTDLLEKAGMEETPFDLWKRDEWTWTNAREYFLDVRTGLGEDFQVWGDYPSYIRQHGIASGGVVAVEQDGTINYDDPATYEAMSYYKGLYDDGILTFYFDADGNRDYQQAENEWKAGNTAFMTLQRWKFKFLSDEGLNFGVVPYPIKDGLKKEDVYFSAPAGDVYVIPKGVDNVTKSAFGALYLSLYGTYGDGEPTPIDQELQEKAITTLSVEGNEEALIYMYENSLYDPIAAFITDSDDAFNPTDAVEEYIVDGTSLTSAFENGQKELEANVLEIKQLTEEQ